ncbi:MAG TPA: hypothetical protein VMT73_02205 [Anaerolineales bacterium]|nr:hypothetical protein [Anaerolineales bacterium]
MKSRIYTLIFIAVFIGLLLVPLRTLALDPNTIGDTFYMHDRLIAWTQNLRVLIGDRVFPKVIVGSHGWLVYTAENDIEDYQKADPFTEQQMAHIQQSLDALSANYAKRGITLLVVVPPNKNTIYPENVPAQVPIIGKVSKFDQLINYLHQHGKTQILDLRPALLAAKNQEQIYYSTDTHWNDYGAFIAYQQVMAVLQKTYPNLVARPQSDFKVVKREPDYMDLSVNIGTTLLPESKVQFVPEFDTHTTYKNVTIGGRKIMFSYNPDSSLPKVIIYHDSFFFRVIPLLGEHFSNGLYIQNYLGGGLWSLSWVDEQKPNVVIIEFAERYLQDLPLLIAPEK